MLFLVEVLLLSMVLIIYVVKVDEKCMLSPNCCHNFKAFAINNIKFHHKQCLLYSLICNTNMKQNKLKGIFLSLLFKAVTSNVVKFKT